LELISPSLRLSVSKHIFFDELTKNEMLAHLNEKAKIQNNTNQLSHIAATEIQNFALKKKASIGGSNSKKSDDKMASPIGFIIQSLEIQLNRPEDVIIK